MKVIDFEATVEDGRIALPPETGLPEHTRVRVVIEVGEPRTFRMMSPRLANPEQAADFVMDVTEEPSDAGV